jgi:hypothetical protein
LEARDVGRGLEAADASYGRLVHVLLRGGDRIVDTESYVFAEHIEVSLLKGDRD